MSKQPIEEQCVNTIRTLSMDAVQAANSGHPGMPMGMADAAFVLWTRFLKHDPAHPDWYDRDRFILSAGHGSMLLYSLLHLTGYDLSLDEIRNFRQWGSRTPGHPEYGITPGTETTTGPLGQGFATGIGMAMAEAHMAALYNTDSLPLTDHFTYGIVSDGDLMEGISHEAASLAGHLKLGKVIYLYDSNRVTIDGSTDLTYTEEVAGRFESYHWHALQIDGHDRNAVYQAIREAQEVVDRPSLIICKTHIGFGSPNKQDSESSHGSPLGEEEIRLTKLNLGWDPDLKFHVPDEVAAYMGEAVDKGSDRYSDWNGLIDTYRSEYPERSAEFDSRIARLIPDNIESLLPEFSAEENGMATRTSSGKVINALAGEIPSMVGGSADLQGSNKTWIDSSGIFQAGDYRQRNIHFGVREHAMAAAMNGMALHSGIIPYGGTFLIFTDYCRPSIRIGALSGIPTVYVLTHDSIGLGEDGPTHQPIEHLASLRAMPNVLVLRPADANEVSWAWKAALEHTTGPSLLILTRQKLPVFDRKKFAAAKNSMKGAYILSEGGKTDTDLILIGTGSEVQIAIDAQTELTRRGVSCRVVSMPSWELFDRQDSAYIEEVLPETVEAKISIEAGSTLGWERWTGNRGVNLGLDHFGASAPYGELYKQFGLTVDRVLKEAEKLLVK